MSVYGAEAGREVKKPGPGRINKLYAKVAKVAGRAAGAITTRRPGSKDTCGPYAHGAEADAETTRTSGRTIMCAVAPDGEVFQGRGGRLPRDPRRKVQAK